MREKTIHKVIYANIGEGREEVKVNDKHQCLGIGGECLSPIDRKFEGPVGGDWGGKGKHFCKFLGRGDRISEALSNRNSSSGEAVEHQLCSVGRNEMFVFWKILRT